MMFHFVTIWSNQWKPSEEVCHVCHPPPLPPLWRSQRSFQQAMIIGFPQLLPMLSVVLIGTRKLAQLPPYLPYISLNLDTNVALFAIWQHKDIFPQFYDFLYIVNYFKVTWIWDILFPDIRTYYKGCANCGWCIDTRSTQTTSTTSFLFDCFTAVTNVSLVKACFEWLSFL